MFRMSLNVKYDLPARMDDLLKFGLCVPARSIKFVG